MIITITAENFQTEVLDSDKPVLLDFWADWCMPCRMLSPVVDKLAEEYPNIKVGKVDVTTQSSLAAKFGVESIPALLYFKDGKLSARTMGFQSKESLCQELGL